MQMAVVILNWNNGNRTAASVQTVLAWTRVRPAIWVVDNASADGSGQGLAASFPAVRCLLSPANLGFAGGNNLAIRGILEDARAEAVLLLNNDAWVGEADVERLADVMARDVSIGVVGPLIEEGGRGWRPRRPDLSKNRGVVTRRTCCGGRDIARHWRTRMSLEEALPLGGADPLLRRAAYVPGTVALVRAGLFREIGLLDEAYFFSGEMADFCERVWRHGGRCAVHTGAKARHEVWRKAEGRGVLDAYYTLRNRFLFIRKFRRHARAWMLPWWVGIGAMMAGKALAQGRWAKARGLAMALADGMTGRFGNQNRRILPSAESRGGGGGGRCSCRPA